MISNAELAERRCFTGGGIDTYEVHDILIVSLEVWVL